jgi:hypothetical protein
VSLNSVTRSDCKYFQRSADHFFYSIYTAIKDILFA